MTTLTRKDYPNSKGSPGIIELDDVTYYTMEQPDNHNKPYKSCVPLGEYELRPYNSPKYGRVFIMVNEDLNVYEFEDSEGRPDDGRFLCLIAHRGSYAHNLQGCIGAGERYRTSMDLIQNTRRWAPKLVQAIIDEGSLELTIQYEWE